jgi:hypothetical protein
MWFFKRKKGIPARAVIHDDCYSRLPETLKARFYKAPDNAEVTHVVDTEGEGEGADFVLMAAASGGLDLLLGTEDTPTENYSIDHEPVVSQSPTLDDTGGDLGGGDAGGGGATDSF